VIVRRSWFRRVHQLGEPSAFRTALSRNVRLHNQDDHATTHSSSCCSFRTTISAMIAPNGDCPQPVRSGWSATYSTNENGSSLVAAAVLMF
jgi:hypothetical protein